MILKYIVCVCAFISIHFYGCCQQTDFVQKVENYFNNLGDLNADVEQYVANGKKIIRGNIKIRRPILSAQFENGINIVINGGHIKYYNTRLNDLTENKKNPFSVFLKKNVDLRKNAKIKNTEVKNGVLHISIEPNAKIGATVTLVFSISPFELRKWIIKYDNGQETTMLITNLTHFINESNEELLDHTRLFKK